jgi:hypothetical protein
MLEPWEQAFGRESISAHIYDASQESVVPEFMSLIGARTEGMRDLESTSNSSMGYLAVEVLRLLNLHKLQSNRSLYNSMQALLKPHDWPVLYFSPEGAAAFRERFAESNRRFTKRYMSREVADLGGRKYSDAERRTRLAAQVPLTLQ